MRTLRLTLIALSATGLLNAQTPPATAFDRLWPVLERAQCRQCHSDSGVGSTTKLQFPHPKAPPAEVRSFGLGLRALVDPADPEQSLLYRKPTNRTPHAGGERIRRGTPDEDALRAWVTHLATLPATAAATTGPAVGPARIALRRLTHSQYDHTVRDLLGDETRPARQFPKEDYIHGFTNQAEGQSISPLQAEAYSQAAARLARAAFRGGDTRNLAECAPSPACRTAFVRRFGARAFRRPLTPAEVARYTRLFDQEKQFFDGARLVTETMLQSPHFLFLIAPGEFGTASRLSYFLWDTMPDDELMRAAEAGELNARAGIEKQVRRMLDDPRARDSLDEFLAQWIRFDRLNAAIRDRRLYPQFTDELIASMAEETRQLFRHLVWSDRNFLEFFNGGYSFLTPELAALYGLPAPAEPWAKTAFPDQSGRAGILGQATFLTLTSKPADTSPTERGIFVREHFLCQEVPPPPPGLNASLPPVTDEKPLNNRQRLAAHLSDPACAGCHTLVDPIGFGLEKFDAIGQFRDKHDIVIHPTFDEMKTKRKTKPTEYRLDIDATGSVRGIRNGEFRSARELGDLLAAEPACQRCVARQLFRYATGREEEREDAPVLDGIFDRFRSSGFRFRQLIIAIATSEAFVPKPTPRASGGLTPGGGD